MTDHTPIERAWSDSYRYEVLDDGRTVIVDVDPVFAVVNDERLYDSVPRFMRGFLHWDGDEVVFVPYSDHTMSMPLDRGWLGGVEEEARRELHGQLLFELFESSHYHDPTQPGVRAGLFAAMTVLHEMVDEAHARLTANPSLGRENPDGIGDFVFSLLDIEMLVRLLVARCGVDREESLLRFVHDSARDIDNRRMYRELLGISTEGAQ
ncbi:MAG: hypothetical protein JNM94_08150 [Phycisphaerae bacterium]|nr:hypothetical protein [Phycisphaerae bacterium]